jgi:colicin import membrane protein
MRNLDEIKVDLAKAEKMLGIAVKQNAPDAVMKNAEAKVEKYKNELQELEKSAEKKVEKAEDKAEEAKKEGDAAAEKKAKKEAKKAEKDAAKAAAAIEKADETSEKIDKAKSKGRGGKRPNAGRKVSSIPKMPKEKKERGGKRPNAGRKKASEPTKIVKPKNYVAGKDAPVFLKRAVAKKGKKAVPAKVEKVKTVRAFGQTVEYKNDSEFCSQLIKAFKKRKAVSKKLGKKKTRPVFGIITTKIKDAVTKAIDNTPKKDIEANPKAFLAKAERLEKSAIRFLEDFKAILGSDFKKSEITSEFGDLEKSIKQMISKYKK